MSHNPRRIPQIGATVTMGIGKPCYRVVEATPTDQCGKCDCPDCRNINCDAKERKRQIEKEGYTTGHDLRNHNPEDLMNAAVAYLFAAKGDVEMALKLWPWDKSCFKMCPPLRCLEKAGALTAAAIDLIEIGDVFRDYIGRTDKNLLEESAGKK